MASSFTLKKGARQPVLKAQLLDSADVAVDLTGATVRFRMRARDGNALKVDVAAAVTNALEGRVEYAWGATDTDTAGFFLGEFELTHADTTKQVVPSGGYVLVEVVGVLP